MAVILIGGLPAQAPGDGPDALGGVAIGANLPSGWARTPGGVLTSDGTVGSFNGRIIVHPCGMKVGGLTFLTGATSDPQVRAEAPFFEASSQPRVRAGQLYDQLLAALRDSGWAEGPEYSSAKLRSTLKPGWTPIQGRDLTMTGKARRLVLACSSYTPVTNDLFLSLALTTKTCQVELAVLAASRCSAGL